jgi:hypothetical protein
MMCFRSGKQFHRNLGCLERLFHPEGVEPVAVVHIVVEIQSRPCPFSEMIQIRVARVSNGPTSSLQVPDQSLSNLPQGTRP